MKLYSFCFLLCFLTSFCGTKKTVSKNTTEKRIVKIESENNNIVEVIKASVEKTNTDAEKEEPVVKNIIVVEEFNHELWDNLLQKHVSKKGNVNYKNFKADRKELLNYISVLSENIPNNNWVKEKKLAYWINTYNAFTIDLIVQNYPLKSIKDIKNPWDQRLWKLGGKWYNLNEIEHQILRKMKEPRIHFAIVCASYSCPKLLNEAFTSDKLEEQLTKATKEFLNDNEKNYISEKSLELSKIFQWFTKDFKQEGSLIDFLNKYSQVSISNIAKKRFKDYNWDLNE